MNTGKTILCSTALATLLAGAAVAQTLTDTAGDTAETTGDVLAQTADTTDEAVTGTSEAIDDAVAATEEPMEGTGMDATAEQGIVLSADAEPIGTVQEVQTLASGETALVIALDESLELPVDHVRIAAEAEADGSYELAMSRAQFINAVNAQFQAQTN
ncbi:hypothetical protein [Psychromarinibacter sp. S121]|uniref:hypothetical protein n=1 Tax=Psychromarinibacter sp. S121 TaxID=3415127 RepID=UPI003C7D3B84